jgi:hypothetical protein
MQILPKWARDRNGVRFLWGFSVESSLQPRESRVYCRGNVSDVVQRTSAGRRMQAGSAVEMGDGVGKGGVRPKPMAAEAAFPSLQDESSGWYGGQPPLLHAEGDGPREPGFVPNR